jgi:hypothetical protein
MATLRIIRGRRRALANTRILADVDEDLADATTLGANRFIVCACFTDSFTTFEPVNIPVTRSDIVVTRADIPITRADIVVTSASAVADYLGSRWQRVV